MLASEFDDIIRPLGASFKGKYWPVHESQIAEVEATVGWKLPTDYRTFLLEIGLAGIKGGSRFLFAADPSRRLQISALYGHHPEDYSLLAGAAAFLEPEPYLSIAIGDTGLFLMNRNGEVLYKRNFENEAEVIVDSFSQFMASIRPRSEWDNE